MINQNYGTAYFTQDNNIDVFTEGNNIFNSLLTDISKAKKSINVMFFILKNDEMGRTLMNTLWSLNTCCNCIADKVITMPKDQEPE